MNHLESERAVVGAAILCPSTIDITSGIVGPRDFVDRDHGQAFALLADLHTAGEPIDDTTLLVDRFRRAGLLDRLGGRAGIGKLAVDCPNPDHAPAYARAVKEASTRRRLRALAAEMSTRAENLQIEPAETIDWAEAELTRQRSGGVTAAASLACEMNAAIDDILAAKANGRGVGLPTGLWRVDECLGGLYPGELIILAARPSIGKSALGVQIAQHNAEEDHPALIVSLEMKGKDIAVRALSKLLGIETRALRAGVINADDIETARQYASEIERLPMYIWTSRSATLAKIRAAARVQQATTGLSVLVIDYLNIIAAADRSKPRWEQVTEASGDLKSLALELGVPVVCLCQLAREAEKVLPRLDHLRDSGSIEQDADVVMLLHRESRDATSATLDIAKNRNGATGILSLGFDPGATRFTDVSEWEP